MSYRSGQQDPQPAAQPDATGQQQHEATAGMAGRVGRLQEGQGPPPPGQPPPPQQPPPEPLPPAPPAGRITADSFLSAAGRTAAAEAPAQPVDAATGSTATVQHGTPLSVGTGSSAGLNAFPLQSVVDPRNVKECRALDIMAGLQLAPRELGRGTYGVVVSGTYNMLPCAIKVMVSQGLCRAAVRELLLGPSLVHPNLVATYTSRCARLTHEFFDLLEGPRIGVADPTAPRLLEPILHSGDGFGDPTGKGEAADPLPVLHQVLYDLKAVTGQVLTVTVQEFCDASTLSQAVKRGLFITTALWGVRLARRALLRTAAEVARGMLHLHDAGVVHGDLKPANVLLRSARDDRRGFTAKVADFGLSHVLPHAVITISTETWGSVAYMAPEAFDGTVSRATDAWAMGVILWEMLTGERPFAGKTQPAVVQGVRTGSLSLEWPSGMDPMAEAIIALGRRCLARRPEDRPSFRAILEGVVEIELAIRAEVLQQAAALQLVATEAHLAALAAQQLALQAAALAGAGVQVYDGPPGTQETSGGEGGTASQQEEQGGGRHAVCGDLPELQRLNLED